MNSKSGIDLPFVRGCKRWLGFPSVQIALCVAGFLVFAWQTGPFATAIASPLLGVMLARPIWSLLANFRHNVRVRAWLPVHGHHFVFKGVTIHVLEDEDHCRWVSLADVRKVVGMTTGESRLAVAYPGRCQRMGKPSQPYLRDDALVEHLGKERDPAALRFRIWAERTVVIPGRRIRSNLGIRPELPDLS